MSATEEYIAKLTKLQPGALGLLRSHAGKGLDEDVGGFDLFAGLWWPLREKNQRAPRREVAWLVAKLYAACPIEHTRGVNLATQLARLAPLGKRQRQRAQDKFDELLATPLSQLEPALRQALNELARLDARLDWARLTDDLSVWERNSTRQRWAEQYLAINQGASYVD